MPAAPIVTRMSILTSAPLTPANIAFYATAAAVIPVLFIAIAVQGNLAKALLPRAADLRSELGKPPSRRLSLTSFRFRVTIAVSIGFAGSAAEVSALLILYGGKDITADRIYVLVATILLVAAAATGPAYEFMITATDVYDEIKDDD
jgi:hypothetical protein